MRTRIFSSSPWTLAIAWRQTGHAAEAERWLTRAQQILGADRQGQSQAAAWLAAAKPPSAADARTVTIEPHLKALLLVAVMTWHPETRRELAPLRPASSTSSASSRIISCSAPRLRHPDHMNREEFDRLVRHVEEGVGRGLLPPLRRRAVWFALIGYAGLLAPLLVVVLVAAGFLAVMIWSDDPEARINCGIAGALVLGLGGWAALRSLLVRLRPPVGRVLAARRRACCCLPNSTSCERSCARRRFTRYCSRRSSTPPWSSRRALACSAGRAITCCWGCPCSTDFSRRRSAPCSPMSLRTSRASMAAFLTGSTASVARGRSCSGRWSACAPSGAFSLRPLLVKFVDWFWPRFNAHAFVLSRANESRGRRTGRARGWGTASRLRAHPLANPVAPARAKTLAGPVAAGPRPTRPCPATCLSGCGTGFAPARTRRMAPGGRTRHSGLSPPTVIPTPVSKERLQARCQLTAVPAMQRRRAAAPSAAESIFSARASRISGATCSRTGGRNAGRAGGNSTRGLRRC